MAEILAFSKEDASKLTGLSERRLAYLEGTGFFAPSLTTEEDSGPYSRAFYFRDIVGLRTVAILRDEYKVPLQQLRAIKPWLEEHSETPWASLTFYVAGRHVFFADARTGARLAGRPRGQTVIPFAMAPIANDMRRKVARLHERPAGSLGRIERNRQVVHNSWVVAGTRIPTASIWEFHEAGYDEAQIISQYPQLTTADVRAAIAHEAGLRQPKAS